MFDRTITLYNFKKADGMWYGNVIEGCTLTSTDSLSNTARGMNNSGNLSIHIHCNSDKTLKNSSGALRRAVPPKEYQSLHSVVNEITFTPEVDFIVADRAMNELMVSDDSFENGFYNYMNQKYDDVYMITNATWYNLIPHFVLGGR